MWQLLDPILQRGEKSHDFLISNSIIILTKNNAFAVFFTQDETIDEQFLAISEMKKSWL
jgi:hypothetical protein